MLCIRCGATLTDPGYCSACGTEIQIYERFVCLSNTYYNKGLEEARARNLSGAMNDLNYSLRLNKNNIPARNLLGLVYFEVGEVVAALTEWIISKNLEPNKNIADEYIQAIQANAARLETINQTIKKYNQSLLYCRQGSEDLAIIQLKKVLSLNPKLVKAHQLLALLYIRTEEYDRAGRELKRALAIDKTDNISLHYQEELEALTGKPLNRGERQEKEKKKESKNPDIISYTSGNETIIMPTTYKESTGMNVVLNIVIGLVVGVALMWFLIVPAKVRSVRNETNKQIIEYGDEISAKQAEINSLRKQVEELSPTEEEIEEEATISSSYEKLIDAYAGFKSGDMEKTAKALEQVDKDELSEEALKLYYEVYGVVNAEAIKEMYDAGSEAYKAKNYEEAIEKLEPVVAADERYGDGYAMYYLARSYEKQEENEKALELFQRFAEAFPGTERAAYAGSAIGRLQQ